MVEQKPGDELTCSTSDRLMASLAATRKVFHSEADFQHALAWHINQAMPESQVRLEVDVLQVEHRRRFLDIWLPVEGIAIELKYKTRGFELEHDHGVIFPSQPKRTNPRAL